MKAPFGRTPRRLDSGQQVSLILLASSSTLAL